MTLHWYINDQGRLCIGKLNQLTHSRFNIETDFEPTQPIQFPVTQEHIEIIGSYPEDWPHDSFIAEKISAAARILFDDQCLPDNPKTEKRTYNVTKRAVA